MCDLREMNKRLLETPDRFYTPLTDAELRRGDFAPIIALRGSGKSELRHRQFMEAMKAHGDLVEVADSTAFDHDTAKFWADEMKTIQHNPESWVEAYNAPGKRKVNMKRKLRDRKARKAAKKSKVRK
jgi:hypothetical protein